MRIWLLLVLCALASTGRADIPATSPSVPLSIGQRSIHVFRAPLGAFSAAERADSARRRILQAIDQPGEGWTSTRMTPAGIQVELDGKPVFYVLPGDADALAGETPEELANQAARALHRVWSEAREQSDPRVLLQAAARAAAATLGLLLVLWLMSRLHRRLQRGLTALVSERAGRLDARLHLDWSTRLPAWAGRLLSIGFWLLVLLLIYGDLAFSLAQFVLTRPAAEQMSGALLHLVTDAVLGMAGSLPGVFVAVVIFLGAWFATRLAGEFFVGLEALPADQGLLNGHTAPTTRRIVTTLLWLFAIAMAYPYLPGANTEAFKGLSVIVGLMASIGASGVVGQVVSGVMLVYTHALLKGEYVGIQEHEGTVIDVGVFETRLRTGLGEEISLPNALVLGSVIRNYSRVNGRAHAIIETRISIGYDTSWRTVHTLLHEACAQLPVILGDPPVRILQSALSDFYVEYLLVVYVEVAQMARRSRISSELNAAILDAFNRHGVQIMSPHYEQDPREAKLVREAADPG